MRSSTRYVILFGLTAVIGFECGMLFERFTGEVAVGVPSRDRAGRPARTAQDPTDRFVLRLSTILDLTADQEASVEDAVRNSRGQIGAILSEVRPQIADEVDALTVRIRASLTPDQREAFDTLLQQDNARFRSRIEAGLVGAGAPSSVPRPVP